MRDVVTLARGLLLAVDPVLARIEGTQAKDPERRAALLADIERVRRVANDEIAYEMIDGVAYLIGAWHGENDPRRELIARVAEGAKISDSDLESACAVVEAREAAAIAEVEAFMATLCRRKKLAPAPRSRSDFADLDVSHLDPSGVVAALEHVEAWECALHDAVAQKATVLAEAWPHATGRESAYTRQADELDEILCAPSRDGLAAANTVLVREAVRLASPDHWPGSGSREGRAREFASWMRSSLSLSKNAIAEAAARLGLSLP